MISESAGSAQSRVSIAIDELKCRDVRRLTDQSLPMRSSTTRMIRMRPMTPMPPWPKP